MSRPRWRWSAVRTVPGGERVGSLERVVVQGLLGCLTGRRLGPAAKRLRPGGDPVAVVARAVGYGSERAL
ncbi:hypothetical protein ACIQFU_24675 [Streptomyces sp. NPDC093065]|uniref:hypothetical protein n=1 Tax=Streptomyces sp. NPDC093065 TaxID=3366021 RepID=UPI0038001834